MISVVADQNDVALPQQQLLVLILIAYFARFYVNQLQMIGAMHGDVLFSVKQQEADVEWERRVERPNMDAAAGDLGAR